MGAVESCCKPGKFSAGSGSSHAGKAFTVADCDPCATVKDCAPCGTRGLKPEVEFVEYPAHIDPTQYLTSRFSVPKTLDSPLKSSMKKKALPTPVKSSVSFKGNIEQGQFLAQDDDSQFVRRRQAPRHLPPPPRLHDEHAEREHMIIWEQSRQAFQAMNPKVKYEEYMTHSKDDGVQRMRMQRMAENSADYYLEASKTYLTRMGGGPTIVKATSAKPLGHQRSGNLVASINPDHRFNEDEFYNELGEALQSTLRSDMPGKGVMHRPEPTSTQQWHSFLGQSSAPLSVIDNHLERNACRLFENGKPIAIGNVWLLKSGCRGEYASDFRLETAEYAELSRAPLGVAGKYAFQCKFSGKIRHVVVVLLGFVGQRLALTGRR